LRFPVGAAIRGTAMIVSGVTREDLLAAADIAGGVLGNPLHFTRLDSYNPKRHVVRLQVASLDLPGARLHLHPYLLGRSQKPRRSRRACGHAVGAFLVAVFERNPNARVQSTMCTFKGVKSFLALYRTVLERNVGSRMIPIRFADSCQCFTDDIYTDTLEPYLWEQGHMEMPSAENVETTNA
jgi:hypothetical protein